MIVLRVEGDKDLAAALHSTQDRRRRIALMDRIGAYGVSATQERFLRERGPDGRGWKPSARAAARGGRTLRDSARLFQSLTHAAAKLGVAALSDHLASGSSEKLETKARSH